MQHTDFVVSFTTAPGFRTAKKLVKLIRDSIDIKNNHPNTNLTDFINNVNNVKLSPNYKLASFGIVNLYINTS